MSADHSPLAVRAVPRTGVIFVMAEAEKLGYKTGAADWSNLGQGMPETGPLASGPARRAAIAIDPADQEYAPVAGLWDLRTAVADLYNARYRKGMKSLYTAENVSIAGGGRSALTRVAAALGAVNLGHFLPDYTAYEELLDIFRSFTSIPILLEPEAGYAFSISALHREIEGRGLGALLLSNPSNPTGKVLAGEELKRWVATARQFDCTFIFDEFYSHYVWTGDGSPVSAARFVDDVDADSVILLDGLTKNWRYPGWRISWILGPKAVIESISSAGSFLDGGGSRPLQRAAVELLAEKNASEEAASLQTAFRAKRDFMRAKLSSMGIVLDGPGDGTFYCWGSVKNLPRPLNVGKVFFKKALESKVIVVPGEFFDVNPGKRRAGRSSRFGAHVRFSFGPPLENVRLACERLSALVYKGAHI